MLLVADAGEPGAKLVEGGYDGGAVGPEVVVVGAELFGDLRLRLQVGRRLRVAHDVVREADEGQAELIASAV